jgi:hypothetical protein
MQPARQDFKPQSRIFRDGMARLAIDGRSAHGRYLRALRCELIKMIGGQPSVVQSELIEGVTKDAYQLALFAERFLNGHALTPRERREESAVRGRFERNLRRLGLQAAAAKPPSLAEVLARGKTAEAAA